MNLEGITLKLLTKELKARLLGGKVAKIFMPTKHSLLLVINTNEGSLPLIANVGGDSPLLYIADQLPERPNTPPAFCMLLRKHLEDGRVTNLQQDDLERVITMDISLIGPARQIINKKLHFELTGKNSNIIFTEENIIIDALRHVSKLQSSLRQVQPNTVYLPPPPQTGLNFLTTSATSICHSWLEESEGTVLNNLIKTTTGIGKNTAAEILSRGQIDYQATGLSFAAAQQAEKNLEQIQTTVRQCLETEQYQVYALINKRNVMKDIHPYLPARPWSGTVLPFPSLLAALNYAATLTPVEIPDKELLEKVIKAGLIKIEKKLIALNKDLANADSADKQRIIADTLMANIYKLTKGQNHCHLESIYDGTGLDITLSPLLTPSENAQNYYKKYNKYKRAQQEIQVQRQETEEMLTYLQSLDSSLQTVTTKDEIAEMKQEMLDNNIIKPTGKRKSIPASRTSQPLTYRLSDTSTLYIGKNNKQNDYVTFKLGQNKDWWFHTKDIPGSHVLLKSTLDTVSDEDIGAAASIAAYYSKGQDSDRVPVDYVQKKFVKKPSGSKPGFVIFTNNKTLYVKPYNPLR
ncbi:MAG: NFACT RNA binding domain-containing protein [Acidaminococcaceae bacterium]|nr:NFACT RNA binding domain-containing protein [Acidaminococcaceae bacterium]